MTFKAEDYIFTPPQVANLTKESVAHARANSHRMINFPIPEVRDYIAPLLPGEIFGVIAQTSNYKSGLIHFWEKSAAAELERSARDEVIIHVSTEESVEEQGNLYISAEMGVDAGELSRGLNVDWDRLEAAAIKIGTITIYRVGQSLMRPGHWDDLHLTNIFKSIDHLSSGKLLGRKVRIGAIFIDYLQALPIDPQVGKEKMMQQRRLQVRQDVYRGRQMAQYFNCPVIFGIQAKQVLTGHLGPNMLLPGIYDGEETSSIAQRFDRLWSQWLPKMTHSVGEVLEHKDNVFRVDENLMWGKCLKQRGRLPSGKSWKLRINYLKNDIKVSAE